MTKIIACSELRYRRLAELEALFRTLQIELGAPRPVRASAPSCLPALTASAALWRRARPVSEAVSASALVRAGSREHTAAASGWF